MRTDITIDRKQVSTLPNASHLGYDKWKAQVGDLLLFREGETERFGRIIGRIAFSPDGLTNHLVVIALGHDLSFTMERWVNPTDVMRVWSPKDKSPLETIAYLLSDEIIKAPIDDVRMASAEGYKTLADYRAWQQKRAEDIAEFDTRHPRTAEHQQDCKVCKISGRTEKS